MIFNLIIPNVHPALAGHFHGHPVVPAALLLDEVRTALEDKIQHDFPNARQVRFIAPITPDTPIITECLETNAMEYSFSCRINNEIVAKGVLSKKPDKRAITSAPIIIPGSPQDASLLYQRLPHSLDMCLIDRITAYNSDVIYCQTKTPQDSPLKREQQIPTWSTLEYAAQAFALLGLLIDHDASNTNKILQKAFIVSVKYMHCMTQVLQDIKNPLQVYAQILARQPQAANCEFLINSNEEAIAQGQFTAIYS